MDEEQTTESGGGGVEDTAAEAFEAVGEQAEAQFEYFAGLVNQVGEFIITYGFQLLGALFVFLLGLKGASWVARRLRSDGRPTGSVVELWRGAGADRHAAFFGRRHYFRQRHLRRGA